MCRLHRPSITRRRPASRVLFALTILGAATLGRAGAARAQAAPLEIRAGDHISIIGNTLADRMQHDGWLEAYLQGRFPAHELVIRNLAVSADELTVRLRSANFGTPDRWLTSTKTDVLFAFFGANEAYKGEEGLPQFRSDLDGFLKATLAQRYNGNTAPRILLFGPIAH
jgi:hypothetical protein